jgi:hypothetical protein
VGCGSARSLASLACVGTGCSDCVPSAPIVVLVSHALASWPCLMCLCGGGRVVDVQFTISHFVSLPAECRAHRRENATQITLCCIPPACQRCLRASLLVLSLYRMPTGSHRLCNLSCWSRLFHTQMCQLMSFLHARPPSSAPKGGRAVQVHGDHHAERKGDVRSLPRMSPSALRVVACVPLVAH